jgi:murein DD-endopeptidase MepM/ murein hydrolase activator NlpD
MRLPLLLGVLVGTFLLASASPAGAAVDVLLESPPAASEPPVDLLATVAEALAQVQVQVEPLPTPEPEPFGLVWPADGQLTDRFGPRWGRLHAGIDIGILRKLRVVAAADGRVEATGYLPDYAGYGNVVLISHGQGLKTLYAHLSRVRAEVGQRVEAGEWIGMAGCTGSCTGTHLHFELRRRGVAVDPLAFLR